MTNTIEKMTNKKAVEFVLGLELPADVREKFEKMLEQINKKSTSANGGRITAKKIENEGLKTAILAAMEPNTLYTIGDMLKQFDCFDENITSQRVTALVKQLVDSGAVVRKSDKPHPHFSLA